MNRFVQLAATMIMVATENKDRMANAEASVPSCEVGVQPCPDGCYFHKLDRLCFPTPPGYYSPADDDDMYVCPAGSFAELGAARCTPCAPGTASWADGFGACFLCGPGTYANEGATTCSRCDPALYRGPGSPGIYGDGKNIYCLDPRSVPSSAPTVSSVVSASPSAMPTVSYAPSHDPSPVVTTAPTVPTKIMSPTLVPSGIPSAQPSHDPTAAPTTVSPAQAPTRMAITTVSPIRPTVRFPPIRGAYNISNEGTDDQKKPYSKSNEIRNKNFFEAARDYLPLMAVAALLFVIGYLYRKIKPRKKRRPHRTVPPPPPSPRLGQDPDSNANDVEAASSNLAKASKLVPKRAKKA